MSNTILPFLAWSYLPDLATNYTQTILYSLFIRAGEPHPQPSTPRHTRDRRRIQLTILLLYFAYTLYEAHWQIQRAGSFYTILSVPHSATSKEISSRYRRLTLQHHPDKQSADTVVEDGYFVALTTARDVLLDPAKRFAYDRFGPDILGWKHTITIREFVMLGLKQTVAGYYIGIALLSLVMQWLGWASWGIYWRWWGWALLGCFEVTCVTRPTFPHEWMLDVLPGPVLALLRPLVARLENAGLTYLPYQAVGYARKASLTIFVGMSRIGPLIAQMRDTGATGEDEDMRITRLLGRLEHLVATNSNEAGRLLALEGIPFAPSTMESLVKVGKGTEGGGISDLKQAIKSWLVRNAVKQDQEVAKAWARAVARRNGVDGGEEEGGDADGEGDVEVIERSEGREKSE